MTKTQENVAYVALVVVWGTTWLAIKEGYGGIGPFWGAGLRFLLASAILLLICGAWRLPVPRTRPAWGLIAAFGLIFVFGEYALLYWGEQGLPSGLTALLFATMPLFIGLFSGLLLPGEAWTRSHLASALVGVAGLAVVFRSDVVALSGRTLPSLAIVASAAAAALGAVIIRRWGSHANPFVLNAWGFLLGGAALTGLAVVAGEQIGLPQGRAALASVVYLATLGSVFTFVIFVWLVGRWGAARATTITLVVPIVALVIGASVRGERLSLLGVTGMLLTLVGLAWFLWTDARAQAMKLQQLNASAAETDGA